jgi:hypothetical protein
MTDVGAAVAAVVVAVGVVTDPPPPIEGTLAPPRMLGTGKGSLASLFFTSSVA